MSNPGKIMMNKIGEGIRYLTPFAYRFQRASRHIMRRAMRKPRTVAEIPNLLPLLIQVLAAFSKYNGKMLEDEIDSSLGFLRHDYPEAVYSELRRLFRQALNEQQDLGSMAQKLANDLSMDRKIMLGVQLYDLISKAGSRQEQVVSYYSFMSQLGIAAQAIDIVYQLNAADHADASVYQKGASPLEALSLGHNSSADVILKGRSPPTNACSSSATTISSSSRTTATVPWSCAASRWRAVNSAASLPASTSCSGNRCSPTRTSSLISTRRKTSPSPRFT